MKRGTKWGLALLTLGAVCVGTLTWGVWRLTREPPERPDLGVAASPWLIGTWHQDLVESLARNPDVKSRTDPEYRKDLRNAALSSRSGKYFGPDSKGCEWVSYGGEQGFSSFTWKVVAVGPAHAVVETRNERGGRFEWSFTLRPNGELIEANFGRPRVYRRHAVR